MAALGSEYPKPAEYPEWLLDIVLFVMVRTPWFVIPEVPDDQLWIMVEFATERVPLLNIAPPPFLPRFPSSVVSLIIRSPAL
jgi:hypothetical protein